MAAAAILLVAGLAPQGAGARPFLDGTQRSDVLSGRAAAETINGHDGDDRLTGGGGDDLLLGGRGRDLLRGGPGEDILKGGPGADVLRARDGRRDRLDCGRGNDLAIVDPLDAPVRHCEHVKRPESPVKKKTPGKTGTPLGPPLPPVTTPFDLGAQTALIAAGDIADCTDGAEQTAKLLDTLPGVIAVLGDSVYEMATLEDFEKCYTPTWGRHKLRTRPAAGDHDYYTPGAAGYFGYWGPLAGDPAKGWYSYEIGAWHVVVLNSSCVEVGGCDVGSAQEQWLREDLAAHPALCTVAYSHSPRFSSGALHGDDLAVQPLWQALFDNGAELLLSGHDHHYERFAPQGPNGELDALVGVRQFVVGTGGRFLRTLGTPHPNSEVSDDKTFGVLDLDLGPLGYAWKFVPAAGSTFTDAGSAVCH